MNILLALRALLAAFVLSLLPLPSFAGVFIGITVGTPPPPIPSYVQPFPPAPNDLWMPGYWAWGRYGYFWVPGTWVIPPKLGYLWTPGYWGWSPFGYRWYRGYWARQIGFYGGINYGFGYFGRGYDGGAWFGNVFRYNTYVTNVNTTIIRTVYVDRSVYVNRSSRRVAFNGGRGGVQARPTRSERAVMHEPHLHITSAQRNHVRVASHDRNLLLSVNHGRPLHPIAGRPFARSRRPAGFQPERRTSKHPPHRQPQPTPTPR